MLIMVKCCGKSGPLPSSIGPMSISPTLGLDWVIGATPLLSPPRSRTTGSVAAKGWRCLSFSPLDHSACPVSPVAALRQCPCSSHPPSTTQHCPHPVVPVINRVAMRAKGPSACQIASALESDTCDTPSRSLSARTTCSIASGSLLRHFHSLYARQQVAETREEGEEEGDALCL